MNSFSLYIAFVGGLVSFASPCVLPIIPGFLSYLAGSSLNGGDVKKKDIFLNSLFFVVGFSVVFALLGVLLNTALVSVAYDVQIWLSRAGGLLVILFGLYLTGLLKISFLDQPHTFKVKTGIHSKYVTSFLFGLAFAAGWTPCVGAALGAILGLAASQPGSAFVLLLAYALGLGLPFLVIGFFTSQASTLIEKYATTLKYVNIFFGALLVILGILIFTGNLSRIASFELLNQFLLK
ncbi:MAG: cytochrome c biogenesis protein CcdA [Patescibacteria group bacterium]